MTQACARILELQVLLVHPPPGALGATKHFASRGDNRTHLPPRRVHLLVGDQPLVQLGTEFGVFLGRVDDGVVKAVRDRPE